jgi:hypothetical protein
MLSDIFLGEPRHIKNLICVASAKFEGIFERQAHDQPQDGDLQSSKLRTGRRHSWLIDHRSLPRAGYSLAKLRSIRE